MILWMWPFLGVVAILESVVIPTDACRPALAGVGGGLLLAFALTRTLGALLYGVAPHDAPTFALAPLLLLILAALACAIPARSASRLNPVTALRLD